MKIFYLFGNKDFISQESPIMADFEIKNNLHNKIRL